MAASTDPTAVGADVSGEEYFRKGMAGTNVLERLLVGNRATPELVVSSPVKDSSGAAIGAIANFMHLSELDRLMTGAFSRDLGAISWTKGRYETMEVYLVNRDRLMLTESIFVKDSILRQRVDTLPVRACLDGTREVSDFYDDYRGVRVAGASMCIPSMRWVLLVETDESELITPLNDMLKSAVITGAAVTVIIAVLYLLFLKKVVAPLKELSVAAMGVAAGDYEVRAEAATYDEIGALARAFNSMAGEIKKRTRELQAERNRARAYLDVAGVVIVALNREGKIMLLNRKGVEVLGCKVEEVLGMDWFDTFIPAGKRGEIRRYFRDLLAGREFVYIEYPVVTRKGEERTFAWYNTVLTDGEAVIAGTLSSGEDITERKRVEEALIKSEEKYRTLFEESKDAVFISTPEGGVLEMNPAGVELLGYRSMEELRGVNIARDIYFNPGDRDRFMSALEKEVAVKDFEVALKRKDGQPVHTLISANAVRDASGRSVAYRGIIHDMTAYKRLEQELLHAQKMEAIGQLTGGIAHDFNNLLTAIIGNATLLQMKAREDPELTPFIQQILSTSERAAGLTQGLLAFGRRRVLDRRPAALNDIIRMVEKLLLRIIGEDIEFRVKLSGEDPSVVVDKGQIEQVLLNLAANARDAMPEGGSLTISTGVVSIDEEFVRTYGYGSPGPYAVITVTDTGTGMDEATKAKIFEPFFTTKEVGKGTGLGLAIVYGIVKDHNGYINVYSTPGTGTTFRIYLPLAGVAEPGATLMEKAQAPPRGTETVLVAEDEAEVRRLTKAVLEEFGYRVVEARDGEEAVALFRENMDSIDLLILDVIMPRKNGREAYEEAVRLKPGAKVIFTSGYSGDIISKKGLPGTEADFVSKPFAPTEILKKVREVLDRRN